jgi:F0F1-type ATP synthase membrane subunit b/b'
MIQDKVKNQIDTIKKQGEKLQGQLNKRLESAKVESQRILNELGVTTEINQLSLAELVSELRAANPTVKDFIRKLDVATYDNRFRLQWDSTMMSAYTKQLAEKKYIKELKPRIEEVRATVSEQLKELQAKAKELRSRISA